MAFNKFRFKAPAPSTSSSSFDSSGSASSSGTGGVAARPAPKRVVKAKAKTKPAVKKPNPLSLPAAPGSAYTEGALQSLLAALTTQKYAPVEQQLTQQQNALSTRQNIEQPAWFADYRAKLGAAQQAQAAASAQQVQSLNDMAASAAGQTGLPAGATGQDAARAQAAAQVRSSGIGNQAALAQNLGGIQNSYLGGLGLTSFGQEQGALQQLVMRQSALDAQKQQVAADKGGFQTTQRQQILSDEASNALKAALTGSQVAENTAQASAATTNAQTAKRKVKVSAATAKTNAQLRRDSLAETTRHNQTSEHIAATKAKGTQWLAPEKQGTAQSEIQKALTYARQIHKSGVGDRHKAAPYLLQGSKAKPVYDTVKTSSGTKQVRRLDPKTHTPVTSGEVPSFDQLYASVALDMEYDGHISKYNVGRLHARGIKVKDLGLPTKAPTMKTPTAPKKTLYDKLPAAK